MGGGGVESPVDGEGRVQGHQGETLVGHGRRGVALEDSPGRVSCEFSRAELLPLDEAQQGEGSRELGKQGLSVARDGAPAASQGDVCTCLGLLLSCT